MLSTKQNRSLQVTHALREGEVLALLSFRSSSGLRHAHVRLSGGRSAPRAVRIVDGRFRALVCDLCNDPRPLVDGNDEVWSRPERARERDIKALPACAPANISIWSRRVPNLYVHPGPAEMVEPYAASDRATVGKYELLPPHPQLSMDFKVVSTPPRSCA